MSTTRAICHLPLEGTKSGERVGYGIQGGRARNTPTSNTHSAQTRRVIKARQSNACNVHELHLCMEVYIYIYIAERAIAYCYKVRGGGKLVVAAVGFLSLGLIDN